MWFFSGMVMMYVPYPELTASERYAGSNVINSKQVIVSPEVLLGSSQELWVGDQFTLTSIGSEPAYLVKQNGLPWRAFYTASGMEVEGLSPQLAESSARSFYRNLYSREPDNVRFQKTVDMDQWTISSGLSAHRPLHLISIGDAAATHLYVSSRTGQVVLDTTRSERAWNWLGSILHWIYPLQLRKNANAWVNVIITLSLIGLFSILTGAIIGISRLRINPPYTGKGVSPYRGMAKYHHILGLVILLFLTTFMFSGLMSMGPWGLFDSKTSYAQQLYEYQARDDGSNSNTAFSKATELRHLLEQNENQRVKQIDWLWLDGTSYIALRDAPDLVRTSLSMASPDYLTQQITNNLPDLISGNKIQDTQLLHEYDTYYYTRRSIHRPLPVLRVKFDDPESTWFHIDMATGQIVDRRTSRDRVQRWVFNGLHSLDFPVLLSNRPVWDIVVIFLCSLGLLFSITSVAVSWRRIKPKR
jgi:uncharacterized iron-regulated membrane protein